MVGGEKKEDVVVMTENQYCKLDVDGNLILKDEEKVKKIIEEALNVPPTTLTEIILEWAKTEETHNSTLRKTLDIFTKNSKEAIVALGKGNYDEIINSITLALEASDNIKAGIFQKLYSNKEPLNANNSSIKEIEKGFEEFAKILAANIPKHKAGIISYSKIEPNIIQSKDKKVKEFLQKFFPQGSPGEEVKEGISSENKLDFQARYITIVQRPLRHELFFKQYAEKIPKLSSWIERNKDKENSEIEIVQSLKNFNVKETPKIKFFDNEKFGKFIATDLVQNLEPVFSQSLKKANALVEIIQHESYILNQAKKAAELREYIKNNEPGIKVRYVNKFVDISQCFQALNLAKLKDISSRMDGEDIVVKDNQGCDLMKISLESMASPNPSGAKKMKLLLIDDKKRETTDLNINTTLAIMEKIITIFRDTAFKGQDGKINPTDLEYKIIRKKGIEEELTELEKIRDNLEKLAATEKIQEKKPENDEEEVPLNPSWKKRKEEKGKRNEENPQPTSKTSLSSKGVTGEKKEVLKFRSSSTYVGQEKPMKPAGLSDNREIIKEKLESLGEFKNKAFDERENYLKNCEEYKYQFFKKDQWSEKLKVISEINGKLEKDFSRIKDWNENTYKTFTNEIDRMKSLTENLRKSISSRTGDSSFRFGREMAKSPKKKKISCDCGTIENYNKLSTQSMEETMKLATSTLYDGVAFLKSKSEEGKIEIIVPPVAIGMPPSSSIVRIYNQETKKAEITIGSSTDRAILVSLDTSRTFAPLTIQIPQINKQDVSEDKIDQSDMDFVLKMFIASKIRGVPVKLDEGYRKILEKFSDQYPLLEKIEKKEFKKADIEGKTLNDMVREISGEKLEAKAGSIIPPSFLGPTS